MAAAIRARVRAMVARSKEAVDIQRDATSFIHIQSKDILYIQSIDMHLHQRQVLGWMDQRAVGQRGARVPTATEGATRAAVVPITERAASHEVARAVARTKERVVAIVERVRAVAVIQARARAATIREAARAVATREAISMGDQRRLRRQGGSTREAPIRVVATTVAAVVVKGVVVGSTREGEGVVWALEDATTREGRDDDQDQEGVGVWSEQSRFQGE